MFDEYALIILPHIGSPKVPVKAVIIYAAKIPCHDIIIDEIRKLIVSINAIIVSKSISFPFTFILFNILPDIINNKIASRRVYIAFKYPTLFVVRGNNSSNAPHDIHHNPANIPNNVVTNIDMNPVSWTWKRGFYMSKLSYEDKINIYNNKKEGISVTALSKKYDVRDNVIKYLVRVIDKHGFEVLRTNKNKYYSPNQKEQIINRVLIDGESIFSVAVDEGLSSAGLLQNWISKYKENGYNIVERKRGRSTMPKVTKKKENETDKEKIKRLEEENLYLKAELEYSKKLRAVVQARKNQQQKKK